MNSVLITKSYKTLAYWPLLITLLMITGCDLSFHGQYGCDEFNACPVGQVCSNGLCVERDAVSVKDANKKDNVIPGDGKTRDTDERDPGPQADDGYDTDIRDSGDSVDLTDVIHDSDSDREMDSDMDSDMDSENADRLVDICAPKTCADLGWKCGTGDNGCGGTVDCGSCNEHQACQEGKCVDQPYCGDGQCKGDENCGTCAADCACKAGQACFNASCCTPKTCADLGKQCGDNGCGGSCGQCNAQDSCDGLKWTPPRTCQNGKCVGAAPQDCEDHNPCTIDSCVPGKGCTYQETADGQTCGTGSCVGLSWTAPGTCNSGTCEPGSVQSCNDGLDCTTNSCSAMKGCSIAIKPGFCLIEGACYKNGDPGPDAPCHVCNSATATGAWADAANGKLCGTDQWCQNGDCVCKPDCSGKECGDDGCGGTLDCGGCETGKTCDDAGKCVSTPPFPAGFVRIPSGCFDMGSPATEAGRYDDEGPVHHVCISRSFLMSGTGVTQGQWKSLMGNNPSYFGSCGDNCPVEEVSWWDAIAYSNALSKKEGLEKCYTLTGCSGTPGKDYACSKVVFKGLGCKGYRLPTEAEGEYAARAGTTTATYNGDLDASHLLCEEPNPVLDSIAWFCGNSGYKTHVVGKKAPNAWGLYDMSGNVWEWCWDRYKKDYYKESPSTDPLGPDTGSSRVLRGGSWFNDARNCRSAYRSDGSPGTRLYSLGFRLCRSL